MYSLGGPDNFKKVCYVTETLEAPKGQAITGFISALEVSGMTT